MHWVDEHRAVRRVFGLPSIALCVLTCTCHDRRPNALLNLLLPSVKQRTTRHDRFKIVLYLGINHDDRLLNATGWRRRIRGMWPLTTFVPVHPRAARRHLPWNELIGAAYHAPERHDYFIRTNDDTVVLTTGWARVMVEALRNMSNLGVVGPTFAEGNRKIIAAMDMTHRTHLCIFQGSYYPEVFDNYYVDDWITHVYGANRTRKLRTVRVSHRLGYHGQQYFASGEQEGLLAETLRVGREQIAQRGSRCVAKHSPAPCTSISCAL
jgi:hypothetical protein